MPTYQYACSICSHEFEVFQAFTESSLTHCPECGGELKKVYSAVGVVFKGSGFYKTDSKSDSKPSPAPSPVPSTAASSAKESSASSAAATPAPTPKSE